MPTPYPPAPPVISGQNLTVSVFLRNPAVVQRRMENLTRQRFVADRLFNAGPQATGGAVIYDQVLDAGHLFAARDVQEIEPGAEFPLTGAADPTPLTAAVKKWGGAVPITYEEERRDRRDVLARRTTQLRNTVLRKVDTVAVATLDAAPLQTQAASGDWTTAATDIISDIETAKNKLDVMDMGYEADIVLLNPAQVLDIRKDADIRSALPRENRARNLLDLGAADLDGLLGLTWIPSNRVTAGTAYVADSRSVGGISDELALYTRVVNQPERERYLIQAARPTVPYVTDPKAVVKITGA